MDHYIVNCCKDYRMGKYCINVRKHQMNHGCKVGDKNIYCTICKRTINYIYRNKHIESAKHLKALKALEYQDEQVSSS